MPRVVPDQKNKYETDELFKKLAQDVEASGCACSPGSLWPLLGTVDLRNLTMHCHIGTASIQTLCVCVCR